MTTLNFTTEATVRISFPSDQDFSEYRELIRTTYDSRVAEVIRDQVFRDGRTVAAVHCAGGLQAELRAIALEFLGRTL
jgi:hypothetical protein